MYPIWNSLVTVLAAAYLEPLSSQYQVWNETSHYAVVVHGRPKTPKNTSFLGSPSPQGSYSPYILGDTTRPRHVTCVLVWSKSDRRRLRKLCTNKQTNKQTNRQTDTTKIMVTWLWTNTCRYSATQACTGKPSFPMQSTCGTLPVEVCQLPPDTFRLISTVFSMTITRPRAHA